MSTSSVRADAVRPAGVPSSIDARQRADRHTRMRACLLVVLALLHVAYFLVPLLPYASCRRVVPWLLWLPPTCVVLVLISLVMTIRRWMQNRRQATHFIPLPPLEEGS